MTSARTLGDLAPLPTDPTKQYAYKPGTGWIEVVIAAGWRAVLDTAQSTASGTAKDFTAPAGLVVFRATVMLDGVSTNGASALQVQIGAGSISVTSYLSGASYAGGSNLAGGANSTTGLLAGPGRDAASTTSGSMIITHSGSNLWVASAMCARSNAAFIESGAGSKALSGVLDRLRFSTVNGTDVFDGTGSVNVLWEGF